MSKRPHSIVKAITDRPDDPAAALQELRLIVAAKIDATSSAREVGTLGRLLVSIEAALRALDSTPTATSPVDEILARRAARGAR
jgi:hypothetical protein